MFVHSDDSVRDDYTDCISQKTWHFHRTTVKQAYAGSAPQNPPLKFPLHIYDGLRLSASSYHNGIVLMIMLAIMALVMGLFSDGSISILCTN